MRTTLAWRRENRFQRSVQIPKCQNMKTVQEKNHVYSICAISLVWKAKELQVSKTKSKQNKTQVKFERMKWWEQEKRKRLEEEKKEGQVGRERQGKERVLWRKTKTSYTNCTERSVHIPPLVVIKLSCGPHSADVWHAQRKSTPHTSSQGSSSFWQGFLWTLHLGRVSLLRQPPPLYE